MSALTHRGSAAGLALLAVGAMVLAACSSAGASANPAPTDSSSTSAALAILSPIDGAVVTEMQLEVSGSAPPGAQIVQDIRFWPDQKTNADSSGRWHLTVDLQEGDNELTFRVGDDASTARTIHVTCSPAPSPPLAPAAFSILTPTDGAVVSVPTIVVGGTATPGATVVQDISFAPDQRVQADSSGRWQMSVDLREGSNELAFREGADAADNVLLHVTYEPATTGSPPPQPPQAAGPSLGTTSILKSSLGAFLGLSWTNAPTSDGRPRWVSSTDPKGIGFFELIGDPAVQRATVIVTLTPNEAEQAGHLLGALAGATVDYSDWLNSQLQAHTNALAAGQDWKASTTIAKVPVRVEYAGVLNTLLVVVGW